MTLRSNSQDFEDDHINYRTSPPSRKKIGFSRFDPYIVSTNTRMYFIMKVKFFKKKLILWPYILK